MAETKGNKPWFAGAEVLDASRMLQHAQTAQKLWAQYAKLLPLTARPPLFCNSSRAGCRRRPLAIYLQPCKDAKHHR